MERTDHEHSDGLGASGGIGRALVERRTYWICNHGKGGIMSSVSLNAIAPDFDLEDYRGQTVRLSDYYGLKHVVLVFNRGFT